MEELVDGISLSFKMHVHSLQYLLLVDALVHLAFSQEAHKPTYIQEKDLKIVNSASSLQHLTTYLSQIITNFQSDHLLGLHYHLYSHLLFE